MMESTCGKVYVRERNGSALREFNVTSDPSSGDQSYREAKKEVEVI